MFANKINSVSNTAAINSTSLQYDPSALLYMYVVKSLDFLVISWMHQWNHTPIVGIESVMCWIVCSFEVNFASPDIGQYQFEY